MKLKSVSISVILVSCMVLGLTNFIADTERAYDVTGGTLTGMNATEKRLKDMSNTTQQMANTMDFKMDSKLDYLSAPYKLIQVGWEAGKLMFSSWVTVGVIIGESGTGMVDAGVPLPKWIIPSVMAILIVILVSILVSAFFKWKFED